MDKPNTSQGISPDKAPIYETLLDFVDNVVFLFKPFSKDSKGNPVTAEDLITQDLEKTLNHKARNNNEPFAFQNQHKEGKYSTDISVYKTSSYGDFCWIEAKRLPTPKEKDRDEREYVIVSQEKENGKKKFKGNGGIQRFKESKHASGLPYSIMIGYIQEQNSDYWLEKINGWIKQLTIKEPLLWNEKDCLSKQESRKCDRYLSVHDRKNEAIILHHFWIELQAR
ncbi:hypothetical protein FACS189430_01990 [Bacteroidia bacterium]|nr:hypothetical protein FACS189430_01990 [Bacteroidia bacterium]